MIRPARSTDAAAVAGLAGALARSFPFSRKAFDATYAALRDADDACVLVAAPGAEVVGYLLGSRHRTFYANGPVASVEEILVRDDHRGHGLGRALMAAFERWAAERGCAVVTVATRRAAPFYLGFGYVDSAAYLRKVLPPP